MNLLIKVEDQEICLLLKKDDKTVDKLAWQDENNLSLLLLKNFDKLLVRNKIKVMDLEKSETKIRKSGLSTEKMIETFSKTLNFCLTK